MLSFDDENIDRYVMFPHYIARGTFNRFDITVRGNLDCAVITPIYIIGKGFLIMKNFLGRKSNIFERFNNLVDSILIIFDLNKKILNVVDFGLVFYYITMLEINCASNHALADSIYSPLFSFSHFSFFLFAKFHYGKYTPFN